MTTGRTDRVGLSKWLMKIAGKKVLRAVLRFFIQALNREKE